MRHAEPVSTDLRIARTMLASLAISFVISAWALRRQGASPIQVWTWLGAGLLGAALIPAFEPSRTAIQVIMFVIYAGPLGWALRGDLRNRNALMVGIDVSGFAALIASLALVLR